MEILTLDLSTIKTKTELFEAFAAMPSFPSYFGKNFDALYDVLSTSSFKLEIASSWEASDEIMELMPLLIQVMDDAKNSNPSFTYEILDEPCSEEE